MKSDNVFLFGLLIEGKRNGSKSKVENIESSVAYHRDNV